METNRFGHWDTNGINYIDIEKYLGFIYRIINTKDINNKFYIGKKQFFHITKLPLAKDKKYRKTKLRPTGWETYTGSSDVLNNDIEEIGIEHFEFQMVSLWRFKSSLWYAEIESIVNSGGLMDPSKCYNGQLPSMKFRPKADDPLIIRKM